MSTLYRGPSMDVSYKISVHFGQVVSKEKTFFQKSTNQKQKLSMEAMFFNRSGRNQQYLQRAFHRCFLPSFSSFSQVVSEEKIFQKSTHQNKELPVVVMVVNGSGGNEQSLWMPFHRCFLLNLGSFGQAVSKQNIFFQKSTNQKQELSMTAMFDDGSGRNEQFVQRTFL